MNGLESSESNRTVKKGKSFISRMLLAFSIVFIPMYVHVKHDRWYSTLCSFKASTAKDQLVKATPIILSALELFNSLYPNSYLQYDMIVKELNSTKNKKLRWNDDAIDINRVIKGKSVPYSTLNILAVENSNNPGYTSHFEFVDKCFVHVKPIFMLESPKVA